MKKSITMISLMGLLLTSSVTQAAGEFGITAKIGTLGWGLEGTAGLTEKINLRFGYNGLSSDEFTVEDVDTGGVSTSWKVKGSLQTIPLLVDWHAFGAAFRFTGGVMYNNNKFEASAPVNFYDLGLGTYEVGLDASIEGSNQVSPYLGIGWGNAVSKNRRWIFSADLGLLFQGSPDVTLTPTGPDAGIVDPDDLAAEERNLEDEIQYFKIYPVANVGVSYHF
jgi:hypothetical protein